MLLRGKRSASKFFQIPHYVAKSESFACTSATGIKLLNLVLAHQYNGFNNGNLTILQQDYVAVGANKTLRAAIRSLLDNRLIVESGHGTTQRVGGKPPKLYAVTWLKIDEYRGGGLMSLSPSNKPHRTDWEPFAS